MAKTKDLLVTTKELAKRMPHKLNVRLKRLEKDNLKLRQIVAENMKVRVMRKPAR